MSDNGKVITLNAGGRVAPQYPSTTLPSGYTVQCRRLAAGLAAQLNAQAYKELEAEKPQAPTQAVEVGPGETREIPNGGDPDYQDALRAWEGRVKTAGAMKLLRVIQDYAMLTPTDEDAVAGYRAMLAAQGIESADSDREIYMWSIVAPDPESVQALIAFVLGISEAQREAIKAQQATFRGGVSGQAD